MTQTNKHNIIHNIYDDIHHKYLMKIPKIIQQSENFKVLYTPQEFSNTLLYTIFHAYNHIYLTTLYLENDQGGKKIIDALLQVKKLRPNIKIKILVDWYRSQRNRIGASNKKYTNSNWYKDILQKNLNNEIHIYGIPINIGEILGVFHLKGFIIDNKLLYSGANLNNEYLHVNQKYRYDRYHLIQNTQLCNTMLHYIDKILLSSKVVKKIGYNHHSSFKLNKNKIRLFRHTLRKACYFHKKANFTNSQEQLSLTIAPLVGLGKDSILNQTVHHLVCATQNNIILCTPYFNMPNILMHHLINLLIQGKLVEIIVGDKTANDFYIPEHQPFKLVNILPYLYEVNLRTFLKKLQKYIDSKQLIIRIWHKNNNGYHIKGIWVDNEWQLLTGNNLNLRALKLDLENALLIHDPHQELIQQKNKELNTIRTHTDMITHYQLLQKISDYPIKIRKLIQRIHRIKFDKLINHLI